MTRAAIFRRLILGVAFACGLAFVAVDRLATEPHSALVKTVEEFRRAYGLPGGVVALGPAGGRATVVAMGLADPEAGIPMSAGQSFHIASLSKPLTAAALLALERQGRLSRHDRLGAHLAGAVPADPRLADVTLTALLAHTAGFDRTAGFDPVLQPGRLGLPEDATCAAVAEAGIRTMQLDAAPGTRQVYSNLGYCILARVIAGAGGRPFAATVRQAADIAPLHMATHPTRHWEPAHGSWRRLYAGPEAAPFFARLGAAGGWQTTAEAFWTFAARPQAAVLAEPPTGAVGNDYYALGWRVWRGPDGVQLTHAGFLPGVFAVAARFSNGTVVVALFNAGVPDGMAAFYDLFKRLCAVQDLRCGGSAARS